MPRAISIDHRGGGESRSDAALVAVAAHQHGVVARRQLLAAGLSQRIIERRLARGILIPIHLGVYAVGHLPAARQGWWLAAVLAAGPDAVLSGRSAAALWSLRGGDGARPEVIAPGAVRRDGIDSRRIRLPVDERTVHDAVPVTTPMRTLLDLAAVADETALAKAANEAEIHRLFDGRELDRLLRRHPRARGVRRLRAVIADLDSGSGQTESALERRFLPFLDAHDLPRPLVNGRIHLDGFEPRVDCQWPAHRLALELDGRATHLTRAAFEADRTRDRRLVAAGWRVVRITWRELDVRPGEVADHLRGLLAARPSHRRHRGPGAS